MRYVLLLQVRMHVVPSCNYYFEEKDPVDMYTFKI